MKYPHEKRHDDGTTGIVTKDTGGRYSSRLLGLDDGSRDMKNPENAWFSTAMFAQSSVLQVNKGGMPKIPCVETEFAEILLGLAKMEEKAQRHN